uniref:DUF7948 domain-containing protein n=1 Tax=Stieleria sp. TaxID=2795976 RepID=UPI003564C6E5
GPSVDADYLDALMGLMEMQDGSAVDAAFEAAAGASSAAESQALPTNEPDESSIDDVAALPASIPGASIQVVFVDAGVQDADTLVEGLRQGAEGNTQWLIVRLSEDADGVEQISQTLSGLSGIDAVHLLSHSDGQSIRLGNTRLSIDTADGYAGDLANWGAALDADADLLIYGCELANSDEGRALIDSIAALTDADVAASDDLTGHRSLGGDWELEYSLGTIDYASAFQMTEWLGLLAETESTADATLQAKSSEVPLTFEENLGQTDTAVDFLARGSGYTVFLSDGDAVLSLADGAVLTLDVVSDQTPTTVVGVDELVGRSHYLLGEPSEWIRDVGKFGAVEYENIYDGINVRYYGYGRHLEYDFIVGPGAEVGQITLQMDGAQSVAIGEGGELVITMSGSNETIRFRAPYSYQESADGARQTVESHYLIREDGSVGFAVGDYDHSRELVIDPILDYGTYLGGLGTETAEAIKVDSSGNAYITGTTASADFPTTTGPFGTTGGNDVFVTKLSADGSTVLYSTYLGGTGNDFGYDIDIDASGNAYVVGKTASADFTTTAGAYDEVLSGSSDGFVLKLDATGSTVLYGSYIGSNLSNDSAFGVAVDGSGQAYVTGTLAGSITGFATAGAYQATPGGGADAFLAVVAADGSGIVYGSYFGGSGGDQTLDIAIDGSGAAYLTGFTNGTDLPVTGNAYQSTSGGGKDAFIVKLDPLGGGASDLVYSSYLGGTGNDEAKSIALDASGRAYIAGYTVSTDFDTTTGAYDTVYGGGGNDDAFFAVVDTGLSGAASLAYSTFLGDTADDDARGIAVDSSGIAWITGTAVSAAFPTTGDAYDATRGGTRDAFISAINPLGSGAADLVYSTFLGGSANEYGYDIALDGADNLYVVGETQSADFDSTTGAYDETLAGTSDGFIAKFWSDTLIVDTTNDVVDGTTTSISALLSNKGADGFISLREAIIATNNTAGADTIQLLAGTYLITTAGIGDDSAATGDLDIMDGLTINGAGSGLTIIDGGGDGAAGGLDTDRVFDILSGNVSFSELTIQHGEHKSDAGGGVRVDSIASLSLTSVVLKNNVSKDGGAISSDGILVLQSVTVDGNFAQNKGGGILNTGNATITDTTISNNTANTQGGGGVYENGSTTAFTNVTISGNSTSDNGGGIYTRGSASFQNVTVTNNSATAGGGIFESGSTPTVRNILVAGNTAATDDDLAGIFSSLGNNLIGDVGTASGFTDGVNGDQVGSGGSPIDPLLGVLTDNGGATLTHALLAGSTAIDAGSNTGPTTDQRGTARDATYDIGAFEFLAGSKVSFTIGSTPSISEDLTETATFTVTLSGDALTGSDTASVEITVSGTALSGTDYDDFVSAIVTAAASTAGVTFDGTDTLTFDSAFNGGSGLGAFTFTVDAIDDAAVEGTETMVATLSNATVTGGAATFATFSDSFTEAGNTNITAHTPDSGSTWTQYFNDSTYAEALIDGVLDVV